MPSQVVDILMEQGRQAAAAREAQGAIWGGAVQQLGQIPGQAIQQAQKLKQQQLENATRQQEMVLRQQAITRGAVEQQDLLTTDHILGDPTTYNPDGTLNRSALMTKISAHPNAGHLLPKFSEFADHLEETSATLAGKRQALMEAGRETLGKDALQIEAMGNDPGSAQ